MRRGLWVLAAIAAALIAAAVYLSTAQRSEHRAGAAQLLYPALEAALDEVTAVRIAGPGETTAVTLKRAGAGWQVVERSGFAADASHVRTLLLGLAQARTLEEKSSLPANYPSLGVEDLSAPGATGTGVELDGPARHVSVIVGKSADGRSTFVRRKGEAASWQVGTALTIERDPAKWLATDLLDIGADRIQSAEFAVPGKRPWTAAKAGRADLKFTVSGKPNSGQAAGTDRVATALAKLHLQDVRPVGDAPADKPAATATYRTFDGLVLAFDGYTDGDKRYLQVRPTVDDTAPQRYIVAPAATAGKQDAAAPDSAKAAAPAAAAERSAPQTPESALAQTRAEAKKLEERVNGWRFEVPSWSYDAIFATQ